MSPTRKQNEEVPSTSTKDVLQNWNEFYIKNDFGIGVQCTACNKWRLTYQFQEGSEVPDDWTCSMWKIDENKMGCCSMPSDKTENDFALEEYTPGCLVWAKIDGFAWWPAMVEDSPDDQEYFLPGQNGEEASYHVNYFGERPYRSWSKCSKIRKFDNPPKGKKQRMTPSLKKAIQEAEEAANVSLKERLRSYSFAVRYSGKWKKVENEDEVSLPPVAAGSERKSRPKKREESQSSTKKPRKNQERNKSDESNVNGTVRNVVAPPVERELENPSSDSNEDNHLITRQSIMAAYEELTKVLTPEARLYKKMIDEQFPSIFLNMEIEE